ncbi:GST [Symbiodinium natans]|uniref:GST protein n=1 Tax=Symbiodinium natans TaxID=878477 RepID=A0A812SXU9_9DINO|nr:GST [Symbiodinium natans]
MAGMGPNRRPLLAAAVFLLSWQTSQLVMTAFIGGRSTARQVRISRQAEGYSLRYFDVRGAAETIRLLFAAAGQDYEDFRYPLNFGVPGDFSTIQRKEFDEDKASGILDIALGKVPVLNVGDFTLPQSKAIERYLARKLGMMGDDEVEEALVDAMAEHVRDINDAYSRKGLFFMKDEEKKAELQKKWYAEELPDWLSKLEKALPGSDGYAVGSKASLADVAIFKLLKDTYPDDVSAVYDSCPKVKAIVDNIAKNEGIKKWLADRPETFL